MGGARQRKRIMGVVALAMFIGMWVYGQELFGWQDATGDIKMAIFITFILGIICGYRVKD
jgi:hypothetical protein